MFLSEMMKNEGFVKAENVFKLKAPATAEKATYTIIASTPDIDRDGEIIEPAAYKNLNAYLKNNPLILWMHDPFHPPVGKAVGGKITENALELDIEFAETEFAQEIKSLYDNGFLNSFSIGGKVNKRELSPEGTPIIKDIELYEVSCVTVPANSQANMIRECRAKGINIPHFEAALDDLTMKEVNAARAAHKSAFIPDAPRPHQEPETDLRGWW